MSKAIKNIGSIQELDDKGFIINNLSLENLQENYRLILAEVVGLYQSLYKDILHSMYIRGSVAKGTAVRNIADLDTVAITTRKLTKEEDSKKVNYTLFALQQKGVELRHV